MLRVRIRLIGALVDLVHDHIDPALVTGDELRSAGAQILILGEQGLDVVDTVLQSIVMLLGVELHSPLKSANALKLGIGDDLSLSGMAQGGSPDCPQASRKHCVS